MPICLLPGRKSLPIKKQSALNFSRFHVCNNSIISGVDAEYLSCPFFATLLEIKI